MEKKFFISSAVHIPHVFQILPMATPQCPHHLVEVSEPHPLHRRRFPLRKRRHKLHGGRLLLQNAQGKGAQHSVTFVNEGLAGGAGVDSYHFTAWTGEKRINRLIGQEASALD